MSRLSEKKKVLVEKMMRETVFAAACGLLEEGGWKGITMEKIARKAGVSKGTVYNYFKDKKDILFSILYRNTEPLRALARSIDLESENPKEVLETVLEKILESLWKEKDIITAATQAYYDDIEVRKEWDQSCDDRNLPMMEIRAFLISVIEKGVKTGDFRPLDPVAAEAMINATINDMARQFSVNLLNFSSHTYILTVKDLFMRGLCSDTKASAQKEP